MLTLEYLLGCLSLRKIWFHSLVPPTCFFKWCLINARKSAHYQTLFEPPHISRRHVTRLLIPCCSKCFIVPLYGRAPPHAKLRHYLCATLSLFSVRESVFPRSHVTRLIFHIVASPGFVTSDRFSALARFLWKISPYPLKYRPLLLTTRAVRSGAVFGRKTDGQRRLKFIFLQLIDRRTKNS